MGRWEAGRGHGNGKERGSGCPARRLQRVSAAERVVARRVQKVEALEVVLAQACARSVLRHGEHGRAGSAAANFFELDVCGCQRPAACLGCAEMHARLGAQVEARELVGMVKAEDVARLVRDCGREIIAVPETKT